MSGDGSPDNTPRLGPVSETRFPCLPAYGYLLEDLTSSPTPKVGEFPSITIGVSASKQLQLKKERDLVLRSLHRRSTVCPTAKKRKQSNAYSVNVMQGCLPLPLTLILVCQFFFAAASLAGFGVRLYVSIVQVGRRPQLLYQALKSRLRKMGFQPSATLRPFS